MKSIEVDFDVFKAITMLRPSEDVTENDVLRDLLGLPPSRAAAASSGRPSPGDWIAKGVRFPEGTEFRAGYQGQTYLGRVENGALVTKGKRFDSPSAAAMSITGYPVNGWTFWECRLPGQTSWKLVKSLRAESPSS